MSISPEFRETGKFTGRKMLKAPERSSFSQTCDLLSQYLKEKRSFGDLSFGTSPRKPAPAMNLFPQHAGFGTEDVQKKSEIKEPKATQMTIIYNGKVLVFDDVSDEKVKELMMLAARNGSLEKKKKTTLNLDLNSVDNSVEELVQKPIEAHLSALPIARKASLHRFLAKRKDRMNARAPYQVSISAAETKSRRLGLISQPSFDLRL